MKNTRDRTYVVIVYMPVKRFLFANVDLLPIENDIEKKKKKKWQTHSNFSKFNSFLTEFFII